MIFIWPLDQMSLAIDPDSAASPPGFLPFRWLYLAGAAGLPVLLQQLFFPYWPKCRWRISH